MDEDRIVLVLARASELRSKITNCIHNADVTKQQRESDAKDSSFSPGEEVDDDDDDDDDEEAECLLNIRDALESLEAQLSSLQALQQQQWYEKEASVAEIDHSRKKLLQKLKEYKGEDLEVISEATAFASSKVEIENNDLILPPYPSRPSRSLVSDNGCLSPFHSTNNISQNGGKTGYLTNELKESVHQSEPRSSLKGLRQIIGAAAKVVVTLVGFVAVLNLSGFEPRLSRRGSDFSVKSLTPGHGNEERRAVMVECPPGKVLVTENGETRCLVKERVEIPFDSFVSTPDVNYGCG